MPDQTQPESKLEELKSNPSHFLWEVELRRILRGERDSILIQLGSADEYVRVLLASSTDKSLAHSVFHEALRCVVQTWQPSSLEPDECILRMLDLIGSFTPFPGFIKTLDFLQHWRRFDESTTRYSGIKDIRLTALMVLGTYYRGAPPLMTENAFQAYVDVLRQHLQIPRYCAYSARRLVEVGVLKIESEETRDLVRDNPASLSEILSSSLLPIRRWSAPMELTQLYSHCLSLGRDVVIFFEKELNLNEATLDHTPDGPVVQLEGDSIVLTPDPELYVSAGFPEPEEQKKIFEERVAALAQVAGV